MTFKKPKRLFSLPMVAAFVCAGMLAMVNAASALPRIAAQSDVPDPKFYNTETLEIFLPKGSNYIPLDWIYNESAQTDIPYHTTVTSGLYDSNAVEQAFAKMELDGYNTVRIFIDPGDQEHQALGQYGMAGPISTSTADLYPPCLDNFIDLLQRAKAHNIRVVVTTNMWPHNAYYGGLANSGIPENVENVSIIYLSQNAVEAQKIYMTKLVEAVRDAEPNGALLPAVFAWELANEVNMLNNIMPFILETGTVTPANGITYDMAIAADRQQCMDANVVHWANQCVGAIKAVDSNALVAASVFTHAAVGKAGPNGLLPLGVPDVRFPARPSSLLEFSTLDYVDVHMYPAGLGYSITDDLASSEYSIWNQTKKPLLMGEFGAFKEHYPGGTSSAVDAMVAHRNAARNLGFEGELYWTWQTNGQERILHMLEEGEAMNTALKAIMLVDADGDGIDDRPEGIADLDGDGIPNFHDLDSDADGAPDATEFTLARNPYADVENGLDADGDGDSDLLEMVGGTDPDLSGDNVGFTAAFSPSGSNAAGEWSFNARNGRTYQIWFRTNLVSGTPALVETVNATSDGVHANSGVTGDPAGFLSLDVAWPQE